jgi:hypothetical protein
VQLPEEFNLELFDVLPKEAIEDPSLRDAFENSLAWRSPAAFTSRTARWVDKLCEATGSSAYGLMLLVSTEPENLFNANWLHKDLWPRPMPHRDAAWSVFLAMDDLSEGGAVVSLIDWAWEADANEVDEQRLWLAAVTLTWLLSTTNRAVRDRATKALVNLLSCKLGRAAALVDHFAGVDDPYITERLLAACYGAAMQGLDRDRCRVLAASVWKNYFAEDRYPPLNLMARDYALGCPALRSGRRPVARGCRPRHMQSQVQVSVAARTCDGRGPQEELRHGIWRFDLLLHKRARRFRQLHPAQLVARHRGRPAHSCRQNYQGNSSNAGRMR